MQIIEARITGFNGIRDAALTFNDPPGTLYAITGRNGAGKTTLAELLGPGALFNLCPSRGVRLVELADHTHAELVVVYEVGGERWEVKHLCNPEANGGRGTHKAFLTVNGVPDGDGLLTEFQAAVSKRLPSRDVFLATAFRAQHTLMGDAKAAGHIMAASRADRKRIYGQIIGLQEIQELEAGIKPAAKRLEDALKVRAKALEELPGLEARLLELKSQAEALKASMGERRDRRDRANEAHRQAHAALQQVNKRTKELEAERDARASRRQTLQARINTLQSGIDTKRALITTYQAAIRHANDLAPLLARAAEVGQERQRLQALGAELGGRIQGLRSEYAAAAARRDRLSVEAAGGAGLAALREEVAGIVVRAAAARGEIARLEASTLKDRQASAEWDRAAAQVWATLSPLDQALTRDRARLERDRQSWGEQAALIDQVPCGGRVLEAIDCGSCKLLQAAVVARGRLADIEQEAEALTDRAVEVARLKAEMGQAQANKAAAEARLQTARAAVVPLQGVLEEERAAQQRLARMEAEAAKAEVAREQLATITQDLAELSEKGAVMAAELKTAEEALGVISTTWMEITKAQTAEQAASKARAELAHVRAALDQAMVDAQESQGQLITVEEEEASAPPFPSLVRVTEEEAVTSREFRQASADLERAGIDLGRLEGDAGSTVKRIERLKTLEAELAGHHARLAAVKLLTGSLGQSGLQAHEIEASAPEVSEMYNTLLTASYGDRFSGKLLTYREAARGKVAAEAFDVVVYDGSKGAKEIAMESLSGGQQVIVGESFQMALAIYRSRRCGGPPIRTFWRDEACGALDDENAARYPMMLRRAMEVGGFGWGIFVAQRIEVSGQADVQIHIDSGRVTMSR